MDETKGSGLLVVVALVPVSAGPDVRRTLNGLRMRGQKRIHFAKESPARRKMIATAIAALDIESTVYDATRIQDHRAARQVALRAIVRDLAARRIGRLTIEQDDSLIDSDRRVLYEETRAADSALEYYHLRASAEPLLWVPDTIAWCAARGGEWRRRISPIVSHSVSLS